MKKIIKSMCLLGFIYCCFSACAVFTGITGGTASAYAAYYPLPQGAVILDDGYTVVFMGMTGSVVSGGYIYFPGYPLFYHPFYHWDIYVRNYPRHIYRFRGQPLYFRGAAPAFTRNLPRPWKPVGKQGPVGKPGQVGKQGQQGKQGQVGKQGQMGQQGQMGKQGQQGQVGKQGQQGKQGQMRQQGQAGKQGQQGKQGQVGQQGQVGRQGQAGTQGQQGQFGPQGGTSRRLPQ